MFWECFSGCFASNCIRKRVQKIIEWCENHPGHTRSFGRKLQLSLCRMAFVFPGGRGYAGFFRTVYRGYRILCRVLHRLGF